MEYHAKIVAQKFLARRLISFASKIETEAFDESNDVDDLLQEAEGELFNISQTHLKREVTQIDPVLNLALEQIQTAANAETGLSGLQTGYTPGQDDFGLAELRPDHHRRAPRHG